MKRTVPKEIREKALADYLAGIPPQVISERYGLHKSYLNNLWRRRGYLSQTKMRELRLWDRACGVAP